MDLITGADRPAATTRTRASAVLALIRPEQWVKSVFVLAPVFFAQQLDDISAVLSAVAAAAVFSLVASALYVLNDWRDREHDRRHPIKQERPLAAGQLSGRAAMAIGAASAALGVTIGLLAGLPGPFWLMLAAYVVITVAYSLGLREVAIIDVSVIATGFVLRVLAGSAAIEVPASEWIILATGLLALLLALGKRRGDIDQESAEHRGSLAGYSVEFIDVALAALAATVIGFYALFTLSDYAQERFGSEQLYLTTFFVAVGVLRYLSVVISRKMPASPTQLGLNDRALQLILVTWLGVFYFLSYQ